MSVACVRATWIFVGDLASFFVRREVVDTMVSSYSQRIFSGHKPVFDGRKSLYSKEQLPIGRDTVSLGVVPMYTSPKQQLLLTAECAVSWVQACKLSCRRHVLAVAYHFLQLFTCGVIHMCGDSDDCLAY